MNPAELLVIVLAVAIGAWLLRDRLRRPDAAAPSADPDTLALAEEIVRLRERVQVLERVVTDNHGSIDLERRIENLRDR